MGGIVGGGKSSSSSSATNTSNTSVSVAVDNAVNIDMQPIAEAIDRQIAVQRDAAAAAAASQILAAAVTAETQKQTLVSQQDAERLKLLFAGVSAAAAVWAATRK